MPNRLAAATSPYLLQHQDNPVDWYPWGEEALAKAKAEDKPIFLSIGYSACHWCHVMAHQSFEDPATAQVMNDLFVNIKVDREERPDLDSIYMNAVVALTGNGGWPMSVFLTPEGVPFFGGTYFPPQPQGGMPAFTQVLLGVHDAWQKRRAQVVEGGRELLAHLHQQGPADGELPGRADLADVIKGLWRVFDWRHHGWGGAPKFPQPMTIEFCLRYHLLTGEATPLEMAVKTLRAMARGGMCDQIGGGFHRYAVDAQWLVPHFEKMLYDNAQLARVYLHAWQVTHDPEFRRVAEAVLDYVQREMTAVSTADGEPAGGFYSATDADSEGEEGKFFVWSEAEIDAALGAEAALFKAYYGVTARGNFEGHNILWAPQELEAVAAKFGLAPAAAAERLAAARQTLYQRRAGRVPPGLDDKVLAAWNGLMLAAFAEAARAFEREDYRRTALANAEFLLTTLRGPDGRLRRAWRRLSGAPTGNAFLEDYANVAEGLLALYETTFTPRYFTAARELLDTALARFADPAGGFFDTSDDHETLVVRPKDVQDNATPSGGAMAATVLLKLAAYTGEHAYRAAAERALAGVSAMLARYPTGFAQWLNALTFALGQPREIALLGELDDPEMQAMLAEVFGPYRPFQVVALQRPGEASPIPLLAGRAAVAGRPTAAVCFNFACRLPVTTAAALRAQLAEQSGPD
ncbi:MAG: thioredoxin domain-containing protein, partial [Anaerolineales bacterium]|nr:thioredoxin domain-containing protein [Anaerolineales bacterium]